MKRILLSTAFVLFGTLLVQAQAVLSGKVTDEKGAPLVGATVYEKGVEQVTVTDLDGHYSIRLSNVPTHIIVSYVGYNTTDIAVEEPSSDFNIQLTEGVVINDVVVVGSRFQPRTSVTSPVPIDNIHADELIQTGKMAVDKMLTYKIPSYNSTQQTISDATAHFDPADLRGLGPSRTLVLINGKRKNASSLVYINDTPGKGEVGVDMKSIPAAAIERVEVLRDGASAQYGSDAIAGVINIILKDDVDFSTLDLHYGQTTVGDGQNYGYDFNTGFKVGEKGYINLTTSYGQQKETNRAPSPGTDSLFGNIFAGISGLEDLGNSLLDGSNQWLKDHPDMGMHVGTPNMNTAEVFVNGKIDIDDNTRFYAFGGLTHRDGLSYALYRTPYWKSTDYGLLHDPGTKYDGFQPTFETDIVDQSLVVGFSGKKMGWDYDLSLTNGRNSVDYTIGNTINFSLAELSPTQFYAGGYEFGNTITNFDLGRGFGMFQVGLGTEFRKENFVANAGEEASYVGEGSQSFPGLSPQNAVNAVRYNFGMYATLDADVTDDFLLSGAVRSENYSDFGNNLSYKLATRYKLLDDKYVIRGSYSTGFRAPSLHQIHLSIIQTLVSGGTISNQGTFDNNSSVLRILEVPKLKDEKAQNLTFGIGARPMEGLTLSADFYQVNVKDRIVYTSSIASSDTSTTVGKVLKDYHITSLKLFTNAVSTKTTGIDLVANYKMAVGPGKMNLGVSYNQNKTEIVGKITTPKPIADAGVDIFDRKEQSRILSARPSKKLILTLGYEMGKFDVVLNNTLFGSVTWQHASDPSKDQTFGSKWITDLYLNYDLTSKVGLAIAVNNLLNVYPDPINTHGDFVTNLGGRFKYPWEVNQFGFNGTTLSANVKMRF